MEKENRGRWASKLGFILATAGAAVGLGNLWKFPYLMGRNGGFPFLVVYLVFVVVLGMPVMIAEMGLGRMTQRDAVNAFRSVDRHSAFVGGMGVLAAFIILSYYSVIGGWLLKYIASYAVTFGPPADFAAFAARPLEPILWHLAFMAVTCLICLRGASGIEKASKVMMPTLFVLLLVLIVRSITLPGAGEGLRFIFSPADSSFTASSVVAAMGQVFYSLSLGMGITITYGSYLHRGENVPKSCATVAGLDTLAAVLAGVAIFPAVFAFGLEPAQGPGLIFGTLPRVFDALPGGTVFAILFFVLIFFAAITSAIALLECVICFTMGEWHWSRSKSVVALGAAIFLLGVPSSLSFGPLSNFYILNYNFFDLAGVVTDNLLLPLGGIAPCVYIGWVWGPKRLLADLESGGVAFKLGRAWVWCIRVLTPALILVVTCVGFWNIFQVMRG